ncbi:MAG: CvpA family protein [Christensenellales bacterium]
MDMSLLSMSNETIGLIIDIVIVLILVGYAVMGILKGFYESLLKFIGSIGALAAAIFGAKPLLGLINGVWNISNVFANIVLNYFTGQNALFAEVITEANRSTVIEQLQGTEMFSVLKNFMIDLVQNAEVGQSVGQVVSAPIGYIISVVVVAVVIYLLIKLIVFLLSRLFASKDIERGGKSGLDRTLGLFLGTAKGLVFITALYIAVSLLSFVPFISNTVTPYINETSVVKPTYSLVDEQVNKLIVEQDWNEIIGKIFGTSSTT